VEASAIPASVGLSRTRIAIGSPLLRIRSDDQLVSLFRSGSEEAFRAIHDRYRQRMFVYTRQMLAGSAADAEDAVQEIFVRAYAGLRATDRQLALRAWLYRIAHNRCIDELRRPQAVATEEIPVTASNGRGDPVARLEQRDALRRLIADVQRLPDQQRSALLMRELAGMTYADVSGALGVSVPAVKSLLVRARVGLAQASEARDTACARIREDLIVSHDRGVRASGLARRHLRDCSSCREFRRDVRGVSHQLAAFVPALGPIGVIAKLLGIGGAGGGSAAAGGSAMAGGSATAVAGTGAAVSVGAIASGHVVTILAAAVVTAGGAIELQHIAPPLPHRAHHHRIVSHSPRPAPSSLGSSSIPGAAIAPPSATITDPATGAPVMSASAPAAAPPAAASQGAANQLAKHPNHGLTLSEMLDPDHMPTATGLPGSVTTPGTAGPTAAAPGTPPTATGGVPSSSSPTSGPSTATGTPSTTPAATGTGTSTSTGTSGTGGTSPAASGTSSSTSTGSSPSSAGSTPKSGSGSTATVTPATSTGPIRPATPAGTAAPRGHGTIAVFTMTGN
jgi:RNA polymerase sigma factor (sigma-70 family)